MPFERTPGFHRFDLEATCAKLIRWQDANDEESRTIIRKLIERRRRVTWDEVLAFLLERNCQYPLDYCETHHSGAARRRCSLCKSTAVRNALFELHVHWAHNEEGENMEFLLLITMIHDATLQIPAPGLERAIEISTRRWDLNSLMRASGLRMDTNPGRDVVSPWGELAEVLRALERFRARVPILMNYAFKRPIFTDTMEPARATKGRPRHLLLRRIQDVLTEGGMTKSEVTDLIVYDEKVSAETRKKRMRKPAKVEGISPSRKTSQKRIK